MPDSISLDSIDTCVILPEGASDVLRTHIGIAHHAPLRIAFVAGPGDAAGTFDYWVQGEFDPRVPVIAYSTQFYSLVAQLRAEALILHEHAKGPSEPDRQFRFVTVARDRGGPGWRYHLNGFFFSLRTLKHLWTYRPHIVLLGTDVPTLLMALLPRSTRLLLTAHNTYWSMGLPPTFLSARLRRLVIRLGLRRMRGAVCTSQACKDQMEAIVGPRNDILVESPQILNSHAQAFIRQRTDVSVRRLLYLGRIEPEKGIYDLLAVFEALAPEFADATLEFAGTGSQAQKLANAAESSKASVRYLGQLNADEVHAKLAQTDLLICPTRSHFNEGLALVLIEAAVHGIPSLVSSNVPAKDLFPGSVSEFPADDMTAMQAQLRNLLADPACAAQLRKGLATACSAFFDRNKSWGTQLFKAMMS
jgi:glycogen(starch) synthase